MGLRLSHLIGMGILGSQQMLSGMRLLVSSAMGLRRLVLVVVLGLVRLSDQIVVVATRGGIKKRGD